MLLFGNNDTGVVYETELVIHSDWCGNNLPTQYFKHMLSNI